VYKDGLPYVKMAINDVLDWTRDWTEELEELETIASSTWTVPVGLTAGSALGSGNLTTQWVTAATLGEYKLVNTITTSEDRVFNRTLIVAVVASL
jgi:hypothetical protein